MATPIISVHGRARSSLIDQLVFRHTRRPLAILTTHVGSVYDTARGVNSKTTGSLTFYTLLRG